MNETFIRISNYENDTKRLPLGKISAQPMHYYVFLCIIMYYYALLCIFFIMCIYIHFATLFTFAIFGRGLSMTAVHEFAEI